MIHLWQEWLMKPKDDTIWDCYSRSAICNKQFRGLFRRADGCLKKLTKKRGLMHTFVSELRIKSTLCNSNWLWGKRSLFKEMINIQPGFWSASPNVSLCKLISFHMDWINKEMKQCVRQLLQALRQSCRELMAFWRKPASEIGYQLLQ